MDSQRVRLFDIDRDVLETAVDAWLASEGRRRTGGGEGQPASPVEWWLPQEEYGVYRGTDGNVYMVIRAWLGKLDAPRRRFVTVELPEEYLGDLVRASVRRRDGRTRL